MQHDRVSYSFYTETHRYMYVAAAVKNCIELNVRCEITIWTWNIYFNNNRKITSESL